MVIEAKSLDMTYKKVIKQDGFKGTLTHLLRKQYEDIEAIKDVNLSISEGEIVGLLGFNGAGKTTLIKMLTGILCPSNGSISIFDMEPFKRKKEFLKQIGAIFPSKSRLWGDLTVSDNLKLFGAMYNLSDQQLKERVDFFTEKLQVKKYLFSQIRHLSFGERMKIELIATLMHFPKLLFLDEPTIGMDTTSQTVIRNFIKEYVKGNNATIIITSHNMSDLTEVCSRVIFLHRGRIVYDGDVETLNNKAKTFVNIVVRGKKLSRYEKISEEMEMIEDSVEKLVITIDQNNISDFLNNLSTYRNVNDLEIDKVSAEVLLTNLYNDIISDY
ncbi:ABC transporter [Bacillus cereus]|uniref:ABC transporter ATP-binding protein n=1 Tax=Bacillus cereus TaxID=1396 RepID=UPI000BF4751D|nr:ATP-binding cassette domain-containing protein [Bacillus cereus]PFL57205.1 ABC transporter [Bacillus cereus]